MKIKDFYKYISQQFYNIHDQYIYMHETISHYVHLYIIDILLNLLDFCIIHKSIISDNEFIRVR